MNAVSLFSSSGIGDLGLRANGIDTVVACELQPARMDLFHHNFPKAKCFCGDVWKLQDDIVDYYRKNYEKPPYIVLATPPCQGMSSNGMGTILNNLKKGIRPSLDPRNRLILPAINIIKRLQPEWVIFENVPNMLNTMIEVDGKMVNIVEFVFRELDQGYIGKAAVIDAADYGVPQHRHRLITILTRSEEGRKYFDKYHSFLPTPLYSEKETMFTAKWKTVRDAIGGMPPLRACKGENIDKDNILHRVPILDDVKLSWVRNTPEGQTAMNNQCINPDCMYQGNRTHGAKHGNDGVNRANKDTPLYCERCGSLLPRPYTINKETGEKQIMKGFVSAYKRMSWDKPASTLTQNFQYACSDNKLHPSQDRVLSLYEGMVLQTISRYKYDFMVNGKDASDGVVRDTIGESIPPLLMDEVVRHIVGIS